MTPAKPPRGLGRGLDALLGEAGLKPAGSPVAAPYSGEADSALGVQPPARRLQTLPIEFLKANPAQPRKHFGKAEIEDLAESIKARGLLQPILVRPIAHEHYEIVAGERRWRAAQLAMVPDLPVIIRQLSDEAAAEIALIENVQRVDLNPIEEAAAYQRLVEVHGRTQEEVAGAVGKSRSHVANLIRLMSLPEKARAAVEDGRITAGHARALLAAKDPLAALDAVLRRGLNVRDTERLVKEEADAPQGPAAREPAKASVPGRKDADTRALEADLASALGLEIVIDHKPKGSGTLTISYRSLDQLDDVCKRLMGQGV
ncbi:MAG TPA: chromosome partitioning protein ParB [Parvularcula sp.]|nr:chromosome partitioning protein ParB [Parvularcula sp.]HBS34573.1 chromosome partitioning protein ParB [Parvularcula sp.]